MHEVLLERAAERDLKALSLAVYERIVSHLKALSQNPRPAGCKKITGSRSDWRIRIGDYRVIYEIDDRTKGTEAVGNARIEDLLEVFSRDREGRTQSIVEVKL